jgi:precorrin-8X/cobalt-precorrin-8 methylmutase
MEEGKTKPALVIGVPVGFVNVVWSKERLMSLDVPMIVSRGRKGGSTVAAAILNALLYQLIDRTV